MSGILVYALHYEGAFNKNSLGAVSEGARLASELGGECHVVVVERVDQDPAHASSFLSSSHATIFSTVSFVSSSSMICPASLAGGGLKSMQCARALS